jgi:uncharacterized protein YbbC (DUF1343 family)
VDRKGRTTWRVLEELGVIPKVVFSPEHGLFGVAQAEEPVDSTNLRTAAPEASEPSDEAPALRVVSLYGNSRESLSPRDEDLEGIDTLVIDIVDVGSRYYTYVWTALLAARAAAAKGIHTLVLDRPNPLGGDPGLCEGKSQSAGYLSFVGLEPIAIRHGLSVGELLAHYFARDGHALGPDGALSVVACWGWERLKTAKAWGRPFIPPSPNMPTLETALLYPGGCLVEGTNLSEGRGTAFPFRVVGAPFLDGEKLAQQMAEAHLPGLLVRPAAFKPTFEKHRGQVCHGVMLHLTDARTFRPVTTYLTLLTLARAQAPEAFQFRTEVYEFEAAIPAIDLLCGSSAVREAMTSGASPNEVVELLAPVDPEHLELLGGIEALFERARA